MNASPGLQNNVVLLEPASEANVDLLVRWTLDRGVSERAVKHVRRFLGQRLRALRTQRRPHRRAREAPEEDAEKILALVFGPTPTGRDPEGARNYDWLIMANRASR